MNVTCRRCGYSGQPRAMDDGLVCASCGAREIAPAAVVAATPAATGDQPAGPSAIVIFGGLFLGVCLVAMVVGAVTGDDDEPRRPTTRTVAAAPAEPELSPLQQLIAQLEQASTIDERIEIVRPLLEDVHNDVSLGTSVFAYWAAKGMYWNHVAYGAAETTVERVMKDSDATRGGRMCYRGEVLQISKTDLGDGRHVFEGVLSTRRQGHALHFYAAGDTGDLVQGSKARFCGIVMGRISYDNTLGGTAHAVELVGMFDPASI